jgi:hypothetical protein
MPSLKYSEIVDLLNIFPVLNSIHNFYESGTYYGTTIIEMQKHFHKLVTVEISVNIFRNTHTHLVQYSNIHHINGASENIIQDIIKENEDEYIFFLDGHYSSGDTGSSDIDVPLLEELKHINEYYNRNGLIIIDDYNLFQTNGNEDWSNITIENVIQCFKKNQIYTYFIQNNRMIIILHKL